MSVQKETEIRTRDHSVRTGDLLEDAYESFMDFEPTPIPLFMPSNAPQQKALFLSGEQENPDHRYNDLDAIDFDTHAEWLIQEAEALTQAALIPEKHEHAYHGVIDDYLEKTEFLKAAHDYKHAVSSEDRQDAKERYMSHNIELYGKPDLDVYHSLLGEKLAAIEAKQLTGKAAQLRDELLYIAPEWRQDGPSPERYKPSDETVQWMQGVVETLYGNLLQHVPDQQKFTAQEVCDLFNDIITQEFGESADGWRTLLRPAKAVNVRAPEKEIIIPEDHAGFSRDALRKLVVHEIGVHMLRSVTGSATDVMPLRFGLVGSYDTEEGLGVVMEQALDGTYKERGVPYYILAGAAYYDQKDFRQLFEMQWRLSALETLKTEDITDEQIEKKRSFAYGQVMRIMRGTDGLPWFKDLAYYNGANDVWRHLESIRGDDLEFTFMIASGKINPADAADRRLAMEARTP